MTLRRDQHRARPYVARLGPARSDFIGYFPTASDAARAVAAAQYERDAMVGEIDSYIVSDAMASLVDDGGTRDHVSDFLDPLVHEMESVASA